MSNRPDLQKLMSRFQPILPKPISEAPTATVPVYPLQNLGKLYYDEYYENECFKPYTQCVTQDCPLLIALMIKFENEELRDEESLYDPYSTAYKRETAVLRTIEKYDIFRSFNDETIENFFACLCSFNCFRLNEIMAVKSRMQHLRDLQLNRKTNKTDDSKKEKSETVKTYADLPLICPICQQKIDNKIDKIEENTIEKVGEIIWQHVIKCHVEWERAVKYNLTISDSVDTKFCTHCFETGFTTMFDVMKHETKIHGTNTENSCTFCGCTCHDIFEFYRHVVNQHGTVFKCQKCSEEFCQKNDLKHHYNLLHKKRATDIQYVTKASKIFFCPFCNSRFTTQKKTENHLYNKYNASKSDSDDSKQLQCFSCEQPFETFDSLNSHLLQNSGICSCKEQKPRADHSFFVCYSCKERFETQEALNFHQSPVAQFAVRAPAARPRNFKSSVFSVTCDVKRLTRTDLAPYPQALHSMLKCFETLHSVDLELGEETVVGTNTCSVVKNISVSNESTSNSNEDALDKKRCEDQYRDMIEPNSKNQETYRIRHDLSQNLKDISGKSNKSLVGVDNILQQTETAQLTVNDRQGNTVIINNQSGGTNTIILGNCCSHDSINGRPNYSQNEQRHLIQAKWQTSVTCSDTQNILKTPTEKDKGYKGDPLDIKAMIREQFKNLESGNVTETRSSKSCMDEKVKQKLETRMESEIREIVRQEFEKYLASMYRGTLPKNDLNEGSKEQDSMILASSTTNSKPLPAFEKLGIFTGNETVSKIGDKKSSNPFLPSEALNRTFRIPPNQRPPSWQSSSISTVGKNFSESKQNSLHKHTVSSSNQAMPVALTVANMEIDNSTKKSQNNMNALLQKKSKVYTSDRDSMQDLYGIKSELEDCNLHKTDTSIQQAAIQANQTSIETNEPIMKKTDTYTTESLRASQKIQADKRDGETVKKGNSLFTEIKAEPESPPPDFNDRAMENLAPVRSINKSEKRSCPRSSTSCLDSSSDKICIKTGTHPDSPSSLIKNKHISELQLVIASIEEDLDTESNNETIRESVDQMRDPDFEKSSTHPPVSQSELPDSRTMLPYVPFTHSELSDQELQSQAQKHEVKCKTVAYLLPTKNAGYIARVVDQPKAVTELLKQSGANVSDMYIKPSKFKKFERNSLAFQFISQVNSQSTTVPNMSGNSIGTVSQTITFAHAQQSQTSTSEHANIQESDLPVENKASANLGLASTGHISPIQSAAKTVTTQSLTGNFMSPSTEPSKRGRKKKTAGKSQSPVGTAPKTLPNQAFRTFPTSESLQGLNLPVAFKAQSTPPTLQGPNIPAASTSQQATGFNIAAINKTLPTLNVPVVPTSKSCANICIPSMAASQALSGMPVVFGNQTISSLSMPGMSVPQIVLSSSIPAVSASQAFPQLIAPTDKQAISINNLTKDVEKTTGPVQTITVKAEIEESTVETADKNPKTGAMEKETASGSKGCVKEEKEDVPNNVTESSNILSSERSSGTVANVSNQTLILSNTASISHSVSNNIISSLSLISEPVLTGQNICILSGNQTTPVQTIQIHSSNQMFTGQTFPILSPIQTIKGPTVPLWSGQIVPQQTIVSSQSTKVPQERPIKAKPTTVSGMFNENKIIVPLKDQQHSVFKTTPFLVEKVMENLQFNAERFKRVSLETGNGKTKSVVIDKDIVENKSQSDTDDLMDLKAKNQDEKSSSSTKQPEILRKGGNTSSDTVKQALNEMVKKRTPELTTKKKTEVDPANKSDENLNQIQQQESASEIENSEKQKLTYLDKRSVSEINAEIYPEKSSACPIASENKQSSASENKGNFTVVMSINTSGKSTLQNVQASRKKNQHVKILLCPSSQQGKEVKQNIITVLPGNLQFGNTLQPNTVVFNQGIPMAVQQNPVVQNIVLQSGQIIPQQMVYQPIQLQQGSVQVQQGPVQVQQGPVQVQQGPVQVQQGQVQVQQSLVHVQGSVPEQQYPVQVQQNSVPVQQGPFQVQKGSVQVQQSPVILPQYIVAGTGTPINPVMFGQQPLVLHDQSKVSTGNQSLFTTANQPLEILSSSKPNLVTKEEQQPTTSELAGKKVPTKFLPIKDKVRARLRPDLTIVPATDSDEEEEFPLKLINMEARSLISGPGLELTKNEAEDILDFLKHYIERAYLPGIVDMNHFLLKFNQKRPPEKQWDYPAGRLKIQNLLMACINKTVDLTLSTTGHRKAPSWLEQEDDELKSFFVSYFLEKSQPVKDQCSLALGFAKILKWTVERRNTKGIQQRVRFLMHPFLHVKDVEEPTKKQVKQLRKRKRKKSRTDSDDEYDSDLEADHYYQDSIPHVRGTRKTLRRKVKESAKRLIESSDTDDDYFEELEVEKANKRLLKMIQMQQTLIRRSEEEYTEMNNEMIEHSSEKAHAQVKVAAEIDEMQVEAQKNSRTVLADDGDSGSDTSDYEPIIL